MAVGETPSAGAAIGEALCEHVLTAEFFEKHWEKLPMHRKAPSVNRLPEVLTVDDVMEIVKVSGGSLKVFREGEAYDGDNALVAYLDRASLIVNQADRCCRTLFDMCQVLAERHFHHVFCVMYLTPPGSQAVRLHNDDQDVFLLQVLGRKHWTIRNAPKLLPYTEEMLGKDSPVPEKLVGAPTLEFTMEAGDVLYIPRGFLHEASTGDDEPSMHITVTMPTSDYCWGVQMVKNFHRAQKDDGVAADFQELCDSSLAPRGKCGEAMSDADLDRQLASLLEGWAAGLSAEKIVDSFEKRMTATNAGQLRAFHNKQESLPRRIVTQERRVRLLNGMRCECEQGSDFALFTRPDGKTLEMDIRPTAAPLIRALTTKPQRVTDLPCKDAFERLGVLELLLQAGTIQVLEDGDDEEEAKGR